MPPTPGKRVFHTLDALRGIAALAVVGRHLSGPFRDLLPGSYLAVDLFFVLSGFVLAHAYQHRLETNLTATGFFRLRVLRLYPLYILGTLAGILWVLKPFFEGHGLPDGMPAMLSSVVLAVLFLPAWTAVSYNHYQVYPFNFPAWSLFWELAVNALYGLIAPRLRTPQLIALIAAGVPLLLWGAWAYGGLVGGERNDNFFLGGARVLFSFFAGVGVYRIWQSGSLAWFRLPPIIVVVLLLLVFVGRRWADGAIYDPAVSLLMPALVLAATAEPPQRYLTLCAKLGLMSYAIYAIHAPANFAAQAIMARLGVGEHGPVRLLCEALYMAIMAVIALAVDRYYDTPVRGWPARRSKAQRAVAGPDEIPAPLHSRGTG